MGALHEGHATLIETARQRAAHVVVTIFLNPLQFGPREDLSRYPRTFDSDMEICRRAGVDLVFAPTPDVIYRDGDPGVRISAGPLGNVLEGQARPGHFDGMLTVVAKLFHLTRGRLGLLRPEGRPAAPADPADGPRPRLPREGRVGADRARARRAGDEQPQHVPHRLRPRDGAVPVAGPAGRCRCCGRGAVGDPPGGPRGARARAAGADRLPRARAPVDAGGRARVVPRRGAAGRGRPRRHHPADRQPADLRRPGRRGPRGLLRRRLREGP